MTWTQVECPFEKDKKIQSYLLTAPIYSEEGEGHLPTLARSQSPPPGCPLRVVILMLRWRGSLPGVST